MTQLPEIPQRFQDALPLLMPRPMGIVPRAGRQRELEERSSFAAQSGAPEIEITVACVGDVEMAAYLSFPETNVPITSDACERWGVTPDAVIQEALGNAYEHPLQVERLDACALVTGEGCDALLLSNPNMAVSIAGGVPVFMFLAAYGVAVVVPQDDREGFESAAQLALQVVSQESRSAVSPTVYATDGVQWAPVAPPVASVAYDNYVRIWWAIQYGAAQHALEATERRQQQHVIVGGYGIAEDAQTGRYSSVSPLSQPHSGAEDAVVYLPYVDDVLLTLPDGREIPRSFAELRAIPGLLEPLPNFIPGYVRVTRFPAELAQ